MMATRKKSPVYRAIAMIRQFSETAIAELDAEIAVAQVTLNSLVAVREIVQSRQMAAVAKAIDDDDDEEEAELASPSEADKDAIRRKIVGLLRTYGKKRYDYLADDLRMTREAVLKLLDHPWFERANSVGGYTLSSDGHVEANRLEGK